MSKIKSKNRAASVAGASSCSATVKLKLTFRCLEYHTIERDVNAAEFKKQRIERDVMSWLNEEFRDTDMADSDINTEIFELDEWKIIESPTHPNYEIQSA